MALTNGKFKGKGLSIMVNAIEYSMDATSVVLENEEADSDLTTFADLAAGGAVQFYFTVNGVADYATGSLWRYLWDNSGTSDVAFIFKPYGNPTATPAKPHFTGTLNVGAKPAVGGTAGDNFTFEARVDVNGTPVLKVA